MSWLKVGKWVKIISGVKKEKIGIISSIEKCKCCAMIYIIGEGTYKTKIEEKFMVEIATGKVRLVGDELNNIPKYNTKFAFYGIEAPSIELATKLLKQSKVILPDATYLYGKKV